MTVARPGTVVVEGLVEGPTRSWEPVKEQVADALGRAGAPPDLLAAGIDGGRGYLEPASKSFPRGQFSGDPDESVARALQFLLEEGPGGQPEEWFSNLRVSEYKEDRIRQTLLTISEEGVRTARRDQPWIPGKEKGQVVKNLRQRWPYFALLLVIVGALVFLERSRITGQVRYLGMQIGLLSPDLEVVSLDAGPFSAWVEVRLEHLGAGRIEISLHPTGAFPKTAEAIDQLREQSDLDARAAISALELGRVRVRVELEPAPQNPDAIVMDLKPLREGESVTHAIQPGPAKLVSVALVP